MADATDAPATDATTTDEPTTTTTDTPDATLGEAGEKALAEFKARARTAERALKNAQADLDKVREASMSEQEKAVAEAEKRGRSEGIRAGAARVVDAEVRAAATGRGIDVDALLDGLDRNRFITDDGEPDVDEIRAWVDRIAPTPTETNVGPLGAGIDLGQGSNSTTPIGDDVGIENMLRDAVGLPKR